MSVVTDVQAIINDTGVFWPTATVLTAINEAQLAVYAETKWALTTQTMTLGSNADIIPIPSNILIPKWIEGTNTNFQPPMVKRFFPSTQRGLEHFLRTWRGNNQGCPVFFVLWDATHWRCFPRPDGSGSGPGGVYPYTVFGLGFPAEVTAFTSSISGPTNYVLSVYNYAAALLLEATRPDLADVYLAQSQEQILLFKKRLRNNQSHNIRTLRPATTQLELNQAGDISELPSYYPLES